jgi:hypothetical protein
MRLEGLREAAALSGVSSVEALQTMMDEVHRDVYGQTLVQRFGEDWTVYQPFPEIPAFSARAPVTVTTPD